MTNKTTIKPLDKTVNETINKIVGITANKTLNKAVNKAVNNVANRAINKTVNKVVDRTVNRAANVFTHLHVHSHFSLLESSIKLEDLINRASMLGFSCIALTDKYVLSGAVEFYKLATACGIKPIIGCEICLLENGIFSHLTILVKNKTGYQNLCQIISKSNLNLKLLREQKIQQKNSQFTAKELTTKELTAKGFKPVFDIPISNPFLISTPFIRLNELEDFSEGLICLSGCSKGLLTILLQNNELEKAKNFVKQLYYIFKDDFYIEIQRYRLSSYYKYYQYSPPCYGSLLKKPFSEAIKIFAENLKIPLVATNDVHYLTAADYKIYDYLAKLKLMSTKFDPTFGVIITSEHYLKSAQEMQKLFFDIPRAVSSTIEIAEKCCFDFELGKIKLPKFETPDRKTVEQYLEKICLEGLEYRFGKNPDKKIIQRLFKELSVINQTGFSGYFLVVADIARFAFENKIPICGKGSAAASLVSYILKISNVDPIENNLYFERFLNEERKEPPDIDIDVSNKDRDKIFNYLKSRYGFQNFARVSSFSTTKPQASLREAARLLNISKEEIDAIINNINKAKDTSSVALFQSIHEKLKEVSGAISSFVRHVSMHPSAVIISNNNLSKEIPLTFSETGELMSQYDMNSIDDLGILKIDLINSLSLALIADVLSMLKNKRNIDVNIAELPYNDASVFKLIQEGKTLGVFQLESFGIRTLARKIKPSTLNDITLLISLYRPGPQQSGMVKNFIERKFGREKTKYIHKDLEPILKETYGVILYQEQAMQIAIKIAGYTFSEADELRKAIVNLSKEKMLAQQNRFIKGGIANGYTPEVVNEIFNLISKFASYAFVKAHAAAYAEISYKTCYLKNYFPAEFLATILTNNSGYYSKMQYIEEARRLGIKIKLPCINESLSSKFSVEDDGTAIRIPLISVKNLGYVFSNLIIQEREKNGKFKDFFDFYIRINRSVLNNKILNNKINAKNNTKNKNTLKSKKAVVKITKSFSSPLKSNLDGNINNNLDNNLGSNADSNLLSNGGSNEETNLGDNTDNSINSSIDSDIESSIYSDIESNLGSNMFMRSSISSSAIENLIKIGAFDFTGQPRKKLLYIFYILKNLKNKRLLNNYKNKANVLNSIPDSNFTFAYSKKFISDYSDKFISDFTLDEKLELEAKILGFYVSDNPLNNFKKKLLKLDLLPNIIIKSGSFEKYLNLKEIITAGIIITKRIEKTKNNENMMFCTLEDEDGMYEAVFFPAVYKNNLSLITNNLFILLKGKLYLKDNYISLIVKNSYSISSIKDISEFKQHEDIKITILSNTSTN